MLRCGEIIRNGDLQTEEAVMSLSYKLVVKLKSLCSDAIWGNGMARADRDVPTACSI